MKKYLISFFLVCIVTFSAFPVFASSSSDITKVDSCEVFDTVPGINEVHFYYLKPKLDVYLVMNNENYNSFLFYPTDFYCLDTVNAFIDIEGSGISITSQISFNNYDDFVAILSELTDKPISYFSSYKNESVYEDNQVTLVMNEDEAEALLNIQEYLKSIDSSASDIKNSLSNSSSDLPESLDSESLDTIIWLLIFILFGVGVLIGSHILKHFSFWKW